MRFLSRLADLLSVSALAAWEGGRSDAGTLTLVTRPPLSPTHVLRSIGVVKPSSGVFSGVSGSGRYRGLVESVVWATKKCEKGPFRGFSLPIGAAS